jgi:hypothetical protein
MQRKKIDIGHKMGCGFVKLELYNFGEFKAENGTRKCGTNNSTLIPRKSRRIHYDDL